MKKCPDCQRVYTDETLNFCLDDGEWLRELPEAGEPATAVLESEAPTRVQTTSPSDSALAAPANVIYTRRSVVGLFGILLVAALGLGGYWLYGNRTGKRIDSIAVMPFVNQAGNPDIEYLSDGMTETLISSLTQLPGLAVKPRSSVFRYKGKDTDAKTIGNELNVAAILNGTIIQRGSETALHVELIDTSNETLLWSRDYKRPLAGLVALQSEVTRDVIDRLKIKLNTTDEQKLAKNYTENAEAYRLYILGRYFWNKQNVKDVDRSIEYFQNAIAIDPNYSKAYAGLADAYSLNVAGSNRERMAKAKEAALRAISLDDDLAEAHASLARPLAVDDYDFAGAERELRRAIELNPNYGTAHHFLADLLSVLGRYDEAFPEHQRAMELEPFSAVFVSSYGRSLIRVRRYDEAITQFKKALQLDQSFRPAHGQLGLVYELTGRYAECIDMRAKVYELNGDTQSAALIRESFAKGGWEGYNRYLTSEKRPKTLPLYSVAVAYMVLGEEEKAFDALDKAAENHEITVHQFLKSDPRIDPLRNDPRFQDLMKRVGFEN
jgi:TolB-like protein/Flp pilus assembly protein TadD